MRTPRAVLASRPVVRRRRTSAAEPLKKATFQIHASIVDAIRTAVQAGVAPSANALVEEAVKDKLRELRRARVYQAYAEAARDPAFIEDLDATTRAFEATTADGLTEGRQ
jgi:hypothetical protein